MGFCGRFFCQWPTYQTLGSEVGVIGNTMALQIIMCRSKSWVLICFCKGVSSLATKRDGFDISRILQGAVWLSTTMSLKCPPVGTYMSLLTWQSAGDPVRANYILEYFALQDHSTRS